MAATPPVAETYAYDGKWIWDMRGQPNVVRFACCLQQPKPPTDGCCQFWKCREQACCCHSGQCAHGCPCLEAHA